MSSKRSRARRCVVQALYQWQLGGNDLVEPDLEFLAVGQGEQLDREYFRELLTEIRSSEEKLDDMIRPHVDRALNEVDPVELAILRLGACELAFHLEVPFRVVINEAVELAKVFGAEHGHKFVNGILDKLAAQLRSTETQAVR